MRCLGFGDGDRRRRCIERSGSKWHLLTDHLLWVIKDKLDFVDDTSLTAVCRDWRIASKGYSKKSAGDGMPWVVQWSNPASGDVLEFISVKRNKKFTLPLPEFSGAMFVFSKGGWILLRKIIRSDWSCAVALVNPLTKQTIKLPELIIQSGCGCFTAGDDYPQCVAFLGVTNVNSSTELCVRTAFSGDQAWNEHKYILQRMQFCRPKGLLTVGQNMYCVDARGNMIIYNMASKVWKEVKGVNGNFGRIVELDGRIIQFNWSFYRRKSLWYKAFKYNDKDGLWEMLEYSDIKDMSLFIDPQICFVTRNKGLKVYFLAEEEGIFAPLPGASLPITCSYLLYDLVDRSKQNLPFTHSLNRTAKWVDLG